MKTAYYILAVPDWIKYLSVFAFLGLVILIPLYLMRLRIPSLLYINDEQLSIQNKRLTIQITFTSIERIYINDLTNVWGVKKYELQISISRYREKSLSFLLVNYADLDALMESLIKINPDKFNFSEVKIPAIADDL